ncbi:MAG: glucokinase [Caldimicrobium sp.]|nr:glucokinase [Caldimicrobium sp.]MCX7613820.1 glucokinase [Caldimicrobium sp.]MDW8182647.1 ROK family protein [Caldimicrobium sp.]
MRPAKDPTLIGDIGGTNSRLAIFYTKEDELFGLRIYKNKDYSNLEELIEKYFTEINLSVKPKVALFAIAGPVLSDRVTMTNLGWKIRRDRLKKILKLERVYLVNDLQAMAGSLRYLRSEDLLTIKEGAKMRALPKVFMAIGTGLGVSLLVNTRPLTILASEGGHSPFSPSNDYEWHFVRFLTSQGKEVIWEEVLSARALSSWFGFRFSRSLDPKEITELARKGHGGASEIVSDFIALLGRKCYELAVNFKPLGGIYLAGGVLLGLADFLKKRDYLERFYEGFFYSKRLERFLRIITIKLILHPYPVLLGAQTILRSQQKR